MFGVQLEFLCRSLVTLENGELDSLCNAGKSKLVTGRGGDDYAEGSLGRDGEENS